jgi:hypothetical protein
LELSIDMIIFFGLFLFWNGIGITLENRARQTIISQELSIRLVIYFRDLGLYSMAIERYTKCLDSVLVKEAAYNLAIMYSFLGSPILAREIYLKYLMF